MPIRVLCTCSLYSYAFVPHMFSFCLIPPPPPFSIALDEQKKTKSSEKTVANEENEARELISNVSLEEHAEMSANNTSDERQNLLNNMFLEKIQETSTWTKLIS